MLHITRNFTLEELTYSRQAAKHGIKNEPGKHCVENLTRLTINILQPLRDALGPVWVTSGYRSKELNKIIGGSATSQHMKGKAADIVSADNAAAFNYIRNNLDFDQLIWEFGDDEHPQWVHVSYNNGKNRHEVLKAYKENGRISYKII